MASHLVRNEVSPTGYQEASGAVPDRSMVPWAATPDGQVVWTAPAAGLGRPAPRTGLLPYNRQVQRERRALAETALAFLVLKDGSIAGDVLHKVSRAMLRYWQKRRGQLGDLVSARGFTEHRKYVFGDTSFGRVGRSDQIPVELDTEIHYQLAALLAPWPQRVLNVHDNFLRIFKLLGPTDLGGGPASRVWNNPGLTKVERDNVIRMWRNRSAQWRKMEAVGARVRPSDLFDPGKRGRINVSPTPGGTTVAGVVPVGGVLNMAACLERLGLGAMEFRGRGMDRYLPDTGNPTPFLDLVDRANLNFGAGPSGTTGTLFQSAILFADLQGEDLKRYLLGVVAYLVGGGMHSCHEVFTVAGLVGIPYEVGKYHRTMPTSFRTSSPYDNWQAEFWDIAAPSVTYRPFAG